MPGRSLPASRSSLKPSKPWARIIGFLGVSIHSVESVYVYDTVGKIQTIFLPNDSIFSLYRPIKKPKSRVRGLLILFLLGVRRIPPNVAGATSDEEQGWPRVHTSQHSCHRAMNSECSTEAVIESESKWPCLRDCAKVGSSQR